MGRIEITVSAGIMPEAPHVPFIFAENPGNEIMNISSLPMYDFSKEALSSHIQGHQLKKIITGVFEHHAMLPGSFRSFYQLPAFLKGDGCRHFHSGMFVLFHGV